MLLVKNQAEVKKIMIDETKLKSFVKKAEIEIGKRIAVINKICNAAFFPIGVPIG